MKRSPAADARETETEGERSDGAGRDSRVLAPDMSEVNPKRLLLLMTGFATAIGAAMYPIYFYPKQHVAEYSEYHASSLRVCS